MRLQTVLTKVNNFLKYLRTRRERKLYKQWVKMAELSPDAIPKDEVAGDIKPVIDKKPSRPPMIYVLLGTSLLLLGVGLILLIMQLTGR